MKRGSRLVFFVLIFFVSFNSFAQSWDDNFSSDDSAMALKYVNYIREAIEKGQWNEAQYGFGLARAQDFNDVLSDISYLQAVMQHKNGPIDKKIIINNLNQAIDVNRWVIYSKNEALILKAELLISLRDYTDALECLNIISRSAELASNAQMRADTAMLRIRALRAIAAGNIISADPIQALAQFRSEVLLAMDRFPRDPRPLQYFFEYARNRKFAAVELNSGDIGLLELVLKRLPFLLEADPNLAWMAAPFIYDLEYSRHLVGAYRAVKNPHPGSIPVALNLGLIDDDTAIEEIFSETEQYEIKTLDEDILIDTYNLLRREEGRELFSQRMFSFTGFLETDEDRDGIKDIFIYYKDGMLENLKYYKTQNNFHDFYATFEQNVPNFCNYTVMGTSISVTWERYPYVEKAERVSTSEVFKFGPAVLQYMPVKFIEIGGSNKIYGFPVPVMEHQYLELTQQTLFSFCSSYSRPSLELKGAIETVYLERGVILQVVETLNDKQVSVTEFDRGLPVIQYIDLDLDGRMETIRQFRRPPQNYIGQNLLDYRRLVASSESDWSGDGKHKTKEVYQLDGSVVYSFDMDGSGEMKHSETGNKR